MIDSLSTLQIHTQTYIHTLAMLTKEISIKLGFTTWDFSKWDCLMLTGMRNWPRNTATKKDSLQRMNSTVLSLKNSSTKSNYISSFRYGTLSLYIRLSPSKETLMSNYSPTGGSPAPLVQILWLKRAGKVRGHFIPTQEIR